MISTLRPTSIHHIEPPTQYKVRAQEGAMSSDTIAKDAESQRTAEEERIVQSTPGLLTLSKPAEKQMKAAKTAGKKKQKPDKERKGPAVRIANGEMLSQSAPETLTSEVWLMPHQGLDGEGGSSQSQSAALTWQQQLLLNAAPTSESRKKNIKKKEKQVAGKANNVHEAKKSEAVSTSNKTWQQVQMEAEKSRAMTSDVFADARDIQTFGDSSTGSIKVPRGKKAARGTDRQRADSMGEISARSVQQHQTRRQQTHSNVTVAPSTPDKNAYAGPNFHNSPSPASLPVPKFLLSKGLISSASGEYGAAPHHSSPLARNAFASEIDNPPRHNVPTSSSTSSSDGDHSFSLAAAKSSQATGELRSTVYPNGTTYPGAPQAKETGQVMTIENLLSRMRMGGG